MRNFLIFFTVLTCLAQAHAGSCELFSDQTPKAFRPSKYQSQLQSCLTPKGTKIFRLRTMTAGSKNWSLIVQPQSFQTALIESSCLQACQSDSVSTSSLYGSQLLKSTSPPTALHNSGVQGSALPRSQLFLSADLCPTKKPLDRYFFERLAHDRNQAPIAISVSGLWMQDHPEDLQWLQKMQHEKSLSITWVNHSMTHPYSRYQPNENNFLLSPGVDFENEVLGTEVEMLKNAIVPSVFFRYPGLVASQDLMTELRQFGLIPLGSDAWLARGQKIQNGSLILVHGNSNEPHGIELFFKAMDQNPNWYQLLRDIPRMFF